ncbi:MAG: hypothetical protein QOH97_3099 [Actinoplanes sp.]|nr:hypothetical protein [Actinoplanes sp.]
MPPKDPGADASGPNKLLRKAREAKDSPSKPGTSMTRQELAEAIAAYQWHKYKVKDLITEHDVGAYERGRFHWPRHRRREAFRIVLGNESHPTTDAELGFYPNRAPKLKPVARELSNAPRVPTPRTPRSAGVVQLAGAAWFGLLPEDVADLPGPWTTGMEVPGRLGDAHVKALHRSITLFEGWDHQYGGGLARAAMSGQLAWACRAARQSLMSEQIRTAWLTTSARLADLSGWASFDAGEPEELVTRPYLIALQMASEAGDVQQKAHTATSISRHLTYLGRTSEALQVAGIARLGWTELPPLGQAVIGIVEARAHGRAGDVHGCETAVGLCDDSFTDADAASAQDPTWGYYADVGQILGDAGHALFDLAIRTADPAHAAVTTQRLLDAYATHPVESARSRALTMLRVATLRARHGDIRGALGSTRTAAADATGVDSHRVRDDLRTLDRVLSSAPADPADRDAVRQARAEIAALLESA